jgi:hypothetical protein
LPSRTRINNDILDDRKGLIAKHHIPTNHPSQNPKKN